MKNIRIDSEIVNLDKVVRAINLGDAVKLVDESDNEIAYFAEPAAAVTFHAGDAGYSDNPETPQVDGEGNLLY